MSEQNLEKKLIAAYDTMMERVHHLIDNTEQHALPALQTHIDKAKLQAIELKELTQEEADKLAKYLHRDISALAAHISESGEAISSWISFDIALIEDRLLEAFSQVADKTSFQLNQLATQAKRAQEYHTGELTRLGTLACQQCDTLLHFTKTSRIPPCPKCHKTTFSRTKRR
jgi:hypothetical protein